VRASPLQIGFDKHVARKTPGSLADQNRIKFGNFAFNFQKHCHKIGFGGLKLD